MNKQTRPAISKLCLALATMLCIATAASTYAATDTASAADAATPAVATQPAEPLEQLSTIWVRGKRLATAIADTEDAFFQLYNRLNKDSDYDITCGTMSLSRGSMIMKRICMPGFLADSLIAARQATAYMPSFSTAYNGTCVGNSGYGMMAQWDMNGNTFYTQNSCTATIAPVYIASYQAPQPSPALSPLLAKRRQAYADNVLMVINTNPPLRQKYDHLVGLYHEQEAIQQRYVKVKGDQPAVKPNLGPRVL